MPAVLSVIIGIFLWVVAVILLIYGWTSRNFKTHIVYADGKSNYISGEGETILVAIGVIAGIIQCVLLVLRIMEMEYMAFAVAFFIAAVLAKIVITMGGALVLEALMFLYYGAFLILPEKMFAEFSDALPTKLIAVLYVIAAVIYGVRMTVHCKEEEYDFNGPPG